MTLTKIEFDVLSAVARRCGSLEQAAEKSGHSLDVVKSVLASDKGKACATDTPPGLTNTGLAVLRPYWVQMQLLWQLVYLPGLPHYSSR